MVEHYLTIAKHPNQKPLLTLRVLNCLTRQSEKTVALWCRCSTGATECDGFEDRYLFHRNHKWQKQREATIGDSKIIDR